MQLPSTLASIQGYLIEPPSELEPATVYCSGLMLIVDQAPALDAQAVVMHAVMAACRFVTSELSPTWGLGAQGVLIEPSPSNYKMLARNRPRALALNLAICSSDTAVHFVDARETSGVYEYMAPSFVKRWHKKVRMPMVSHGNDRVAGSRGFTADHGIGQVEPLGSVACGDHACFNRPRVR